MTEKRSLRVALIGQGFMGRAHSNAYNQVGHFFDLPYRLERTVICGRDTARLDKMAATWGWAETAIDWRAVIDRKDIDVVDVAVPNHMHAPIVSAAAEAGKIVLCEKPLANSVEEAERMVAAASKVRTMVWHNYRRAPAVQFAHQLIQEGKLGQIFHYRGQYLQEQSEPLGDGQVAVVAVSRDGCADNVLECQVGLTLVRHARIQQAGDVGMIQTRQDFALARKPLGNDAAQERRMNQLESHLAFEQPVGALGQPHAAHSPVTQQ